MCCAITSIFTTVRRSHTSARYGLSDAYDHSSLRLGDGNDSLDELDTPMEDEDEDEDDSSSVSSSEDEEGNTRPMRLMWPTRPLCLPLLPLRMRR